MKKFKINLFECIVALTIVAAINYVLLQFSSTTTNISPGQKAFSTYSIANLSSVVVGFTGQSLDLNSTTLFDHIDEYSALPAFADDNSEYVIASLLERRMDKMAGIESELAVTTFLFCHNLLSLPQLKRYFQRTHSNHSDISRWKAAYKQFQHTSYSLAGERRHWRDTKAHSEDPRRNENLYCRIYLVEETMTAMRPSENDSLSWQLYNASSAIFVRGEFVPNRLTADSNANRKLDILRCVIPLSENPRHSLVSFLLSPAKDRDLQQERRNVSIAVELWRGSAADTVQSSPTNRLIRFAIPTTTERTGLFVTAAHSKNVRPHAGPLSTGISAENGTAVSRNAHMSRPIVHLCIPAMRRILSRENLPSLLEFLSHHLSIGISHIYLPCPHSADSLHTRRLLHLLNSYVASGQVSIIPQSSSSAAVSGSSGEGRFAFAGVQWDLLLVKVLQSNACLYMAKGRSDYLLILDVDELLVPRSSHGYRDLPSLIADADTNPERTSSFIGSEISHQVMNGWRGGPGFADRDGHPLCYMSLSSEVLLPSRRQQQDQRPWLSDRFPQLSEVNTSMSNQVASSAYERILLPTNRVYYTGLNSPGACRLEKGWNGCQNDRLCKGVGPAGEPWRMEMVSLGQDQGSAINFRRDHFFDELVVPGDGKKLSPITQAVVYHFALYEQTMVASSQAIRGRNEYATQYAAAAMSDIRRRGLDVVVELPNTDPDAHVLALRGLQQPLFTADEIDKLSSPDKGARQAVVEPPIPIQRQIELVVPPLPTATRYAFESSPSSSSDMPSLTSLPNFARDHSEFLTAAVLERTSESWQLHVTCFFLCHELLQPRIGLSAAGGLKVHPAMVNRWQQTLRNYDTTRYRQNGIRAVDEQQPALSCRIRHLSFSYKTDGVFIPNNLSPDSNANKRLDILRCPLIAEHWEDIYNRFSTEDIDDVTVEILRGNFSLIAFNVSWHSRGAGYMFDFPLYNRPNLLTSTLDVWRGFRESYPNNLHWKHDTIYLCVPGSSVLPSKEMLPYYLEFVQHHINMGAAHIFLGVAFAWDSHYMRILLRVLQSFIRSGYVTVQSHGGDSLDLTFSLAGLTMERDNLKTLHVNMCTYLAKGMADYVGVWDLDEYFIPRGENTNLIDFITALDNYSPNQPPIEVRYATVHGSRELAEVYTSGWKGGRGFASGDAHPLCYISLHADVFLYPKNYVAETPDLDRFTWMGDRFPFGPEISDKKGLNLKKSIRPTRKTFQGGLHQPAACQLPADWDSCSNNSRIQRVDGLCYGRGEAGYRLLFLNNSFVDFHMDHRFDDKTSEKDAKIASMQSDGAIFHMQFHRYWFKASAEAAQHTNEYVTKGFFQRVLEGLHDRGLFAPMFLPQDNFSDANAGSHSSVVKLLATSQAFTNNNMVRANGSETVANHFIWGSALRLKIAPLTNSDSMMLNAVLEVYAPPDQILDNKLKCRFLVDSKTVATLHCDRSGETNFASFPPVDVSIQWCSCKVQVPIVVSMLESIASIHIRASLLLDDDIVIADFSGTRRVQQDIWHHYWQGGLDSLQPLSMSYSEPPGQVIPGLALCVDASDIPLSPETLPLYLEFLQHHVSLGVRHIWLLLPLRSESIHFKKMMLIFHTYIHEGRLSLFAQPTMQVSNYLFLLQCSIQAHSTASHIASWRLNNFLMADNLTSFLVLPTTACWRLEQWAVPADEGLLRKRRMKSTPLWIGEAFTGQVARRIKGARPELGLGLVVPLTYPTTQTDLLTCSNATITSGAFLQLFQLIGESLPLDVSVSMSPFPSPRQLYTQLSYPAVRSALAERQLDLLVDIPRRWPLPDSVALPDANWVDFKQVYLHRAEAAMMN